MKDTSTGADIFESVIKLITEKNLGSAKIQLEHSIFRREKKKLVSSLQEHIGILRKLIKFHCIIHQDALCLNALNFKYIMTVVVKTVGFILSQ